MGDHESMIPALDGEQHVIAAAQHIVKALAATSNLNNDMKKLLADLDTQLSTMTRLTERENVGNSEVEDRLKFAQRTVISWQSNELMIWASSPQEASEYLQAVEEVRRLTVSLGSLLSSRDGKEKELLDQARNVLQMGMARLEEELVHILAHSKQSFEPETLSFRSCEDNGGYEESVVSTEADFVVEDTSGRASSGTESEECLIDLVHPDVIPDIKAIAKIMFASDYDQEFCEAFIRFWKDALDEYLSILGVEKLSIENVMSMDWNSLNRVTRKWCWAMKNIRFFLVSEKRLFEQVLGEFGCHSTCFVEASKVSMLCLLNFGMAIAIGPHQLERLFRLIDMYEVLANVLQDVDVLYAEEVGSILRIEFHELSRRLGESARATFLEFGNQIASYTSYTPFPKGGIHHITRYVMNYIKLLAAYGETLNLLLEEEQYTDDLDSDPLDAATCAMARHLWSVASMLETNLDYISNLYRDASLKHIFMMNNIHYIAQKVKDSEELRRYFGDEWIRKHIGKFQHHATSYVGATWSSVLSLLRDDGKTGRAILKDRCRGFSIAFDEVYKSHTGWLVPDPHLREDLRILTSYVIHAYRTFVGRNSTFISEKYIKYTADDLESLILHLFEGSSRSLPSPRRQ